MFSVKRISLVALALLALIASMGLIQHQSARAATFTVNVGDDWFGYPGSGTRGVVAVVTVTTGDAVQWTWGAGVADHNVRGTDSTYSTNVASGPIPAAMTPATSAAPFTYGPLTFNTAGTYYFRCSLHPADMRGRIVVNAPAPDTTAPTVSGTSASPNPTDGAGSVSLTATVNDDRGVTGATYAVDGGAQSAMSVSGTTASASVAVGALSIGAHSIVVRASDAAGNTGVGAAYTLNVTATPAGAVQASVTLTAGSLANTAQAVGFGSAALTGTSQERAGTTTAWQASDARGSGAGWNVTITSTNFSSSGGSIAVSNFRIALAQAAIVAVGTTSPSPTTQVPTAVPIPLTGSSAQKVLSAASGNGMGTYTYTPDFALTIPASAAPGAYTANMTVSVNSGP